MDNQKDNKEVGIYKESYLISTVFIKDNTLQFVFKKTEKIITAIYLITNFFVPQEPLKWSLRESSNKLLKTLMSFSQAGLSEREKMVGELNSDLLELTSLFDLAYHSGFISQMNYQILNSELSNLTVEIIKYEDESISSNKGLFDHNYFQVQRGEGNDLEANGAGSADRNYKGQKDTLLQNDFYKRSSDFYTPRQGSLPGNNSAINPAVKSGNNVKDKYFGYGSANTDQTGRPKKKKTNDERRTKIVAEIKRQKLVSVKEVMRVLPDLSEKTIQRELLSMVDDGILNKTGERRWSRYSLTRG